MWNPPAHTSLEATALNDTRYPSAFPAVCQLMPSQCSTTEAFGSEDLTPTAQTSSEAMPLTALRRRSLPPATGVLVQVVPSQCIARDRLVSLGANHPTAQASLASIVDTLRSELCLPGTVTDAARQADPSQCTNNPVGFSG